MFALYTTMQAAPVAFQTTTPLEYGVLPLFAAGSCATSSSHLFVLCLQVLEQSFPSHGRTGYVVNFPPISLVPIKDDSIKYWECGCAFKKFQVDHELLLVESSTGIF